VRQTRLQALGDDEYLLGSLELAIEIADGKNRIVQRKTELYLQHGAETVWVVDHWKQIVQDHRTDALMRERHLGESMEFSGVVLPLRILFPSTREK
jgi:hypothetical protein